MLILASVVAITVYRLAVFFTFSRELRNTNLTIAEPIKEYVTPQMATSVTASLISFVVIMILNILYERVAIWITDFGELNIQLYCLSSMENNLIQSFHIRHNNRTSTNQDGLWEQLDSEDVPLSICQLLLLMFLHRLCKGESSWPSRKACLSFGKIQKWGGTISP